MDPRPKSTVRMRKITRKKVFAEFVASRQAEPERGTPRRWTCCNRTFSEPLEVYRHISSEHGKELDLRIQRALEGSGRINEEREPRNADSEPDAAKGRLAGPESDAAKRCDCERERCRDRGQPCPVDRGSSRTDRVLPWLPSVAEMDSVDGEADGNQREGQVLLFYRYVELEEPGDICAWQRELCRRLRLHGKIRIAKEGLNGTVGGPLLATQRYIKAVLAHPCFTDMKTGDFKTSKGGRDSFPDGLVVSVHHEIVPMGMDPCRISYKDAGCHLSPAEFHEEVLRYQQAKEKGQEPERIFVDCRNFYESKIGAFTDAITPDIRKFSYWPEYVDRNEAVFADKTVLMYCTGGIRCERGSAYLRSKGICKDVLQLEGGIHRYLEQYPDGFFRGKLFVFDNRYSIQTNQDVIAKCVHCSSAWDEYQPCTSPHCHQLVLSCPSCRGSGRTTCCLRCAQLAAENDDAPGDGRRPKKRREECLCTIKRERIPTETLARGPAADASAGNAESAETSSGNAESESDER